MFFFLLGLVSILGQGVILREIVNLSYGNEFVYGLGLGFWLVLVGIGSVFGRKIRKIPKKILGFLVIFWFVLLPFLVLGLRFLASKIIVSGQLPSFFQAFLLLVLPLLVFCPFLGFLFVAGVKNFKANLNLAYFWETIGFFVGGIIFSFWLAKISFPFFLEKIYAGFSKVVNTPYQQIIQTETLGQKNVYLSGQLAFSSQQKQDMEQLVGLILPSIRSVDKVLVYGNPNLASVISLHPKVKEIEFLELDPALLDLEKDFLNPRIKAKAGDLKIFLEKSPESFDLIIINLAPPSSLFLNRFYTQEFFKIIQKSLKNKGSFALIFSLPTGYQSQEATRFARSIYQTFTSVFVKNFLFSLENQVILLGGVKEIEPQQQELYFLEKIYPSFSADYFQYQKAKPGREELLEKLKFPKEKLNKDVFPVAFFYQTLFWQTLFSFEIPKILFSLRVWLVLTFLLGVLGVFYGVNRTNWTNGIFQKLLTVCFSSFVLMSLQVILLFLFQTKFGSVYSHLAFLNGLVLLGMAVGVRGIGKVRGTQGILGYILVMLGIILGIKGNWKVWEWWVMALVLGFSGGSIFAFVSKQLTGKRQQLLVYTFDLLGAFGGAVLTSLFLFPVLGIYKVFLILGSLVFLFFPNTRNF